MCFHDDRPVRPRLGTDPPGSDVAQSFRNSLDLACHAERLGYRRYWLAEHHNMPSVASAATSVVIGHMAAGTSTIRVGAGGIMLPNHAPLVIVDAQGDARGLTPFLAQLTAGAVDGLVREVLIVAGLDDAIAAICEASGADRHNALETAAAGGRSAQVLVLPAGFRLRDG